MFPKTKIKRNHLQHIVWNEANDPLSKDVVEQLSVVMEIPLSAAYIPYYP